MVDITGLSRRMVAVIIILKQPNDDMLLCVDNDMVSVTGWMMNVVALQLLLEFLLLVLMGTV